MTDTHPAPHNASAPKREIHCGDALPWLAANAPLTGCSFITSLPDISGLPHLSLDEWKAWFIGAARATLAATEDEGVTIFYQTDIKRDGVWIDKGYLCQRAAEEHGASLLWHKVVCRKAAGTPSFGRPSYAHLLCYSRRIRDQLARSTADVLPSLGEMTWSQAMGTAACELACRYVQTHTQSKTIVDPFCGLGTVLAVANAMGFDAIGVEIGKKRAKKARNLLLPSRRAGEPRAWR